MSAKWRALQHRHRYTYSAIIFPQYYTEALNQLTIDSSCSKYYTELNELISLNSTYAQVSHVKKLASAFGDLLANGEEYLVSVAARFYLEILFLENSLPLHRTLVSVLAKTRSFQTIIGGCFRSLCEEYGGVKGKGKRFCVSRAALSMMGSPKLGYLVEIVEECAIVVALDIVYGLNSVVLETNDWSQPSPIVMEQCQEALSCMYYLLQRFPLKFIDLNGQEKVSKLRDSDVLEMIVTTILGILKSVAFSRDCFVAAGVSFCVALQACLTPEELGLVIMEGIFCHTSVIILQSECLNPVMKVPCKQALFSEIRNLSVLSRLCLIRGILTSVSRTVLNTRFVVSEDESSNGIYTRGDTRTILYDGILPELCIYCENPTDSHFNFHALTVLQICLQQIKTSIQTNLGGPTENNPISEKMGTRLLRIVWNNLEDPLSQTVKQVHLIFDLFLDIQASLNWAEGSERIKLFLRNIASDLLRMGSRCKGRYIPLALLTKRLGAKTILDMNPELLFETTHAYIDDDVCCAATSFLKCFLERLRDECWSSDGVEGGFIVYRGHCLRPFLYGLASGVSKLRSNLNTYALPVLLEVDVDCIFPMLSFVSLEQEREDIDVVFPELNGTDIVLRVEQQVAVLVSLLKVSRSLALIEGDIDWFENSSTEKSGSYALVTVKGMPVKVLVKWLILALTHVDDSLRVDAAETLFLNPKTASLPSSLELSLMKEAIPLNMRSCSTAFQMKLTSLFRKFFSRVRTALERQLKLSWQPHASQENNETGPVKGTDINRAEDLYQFMKWLSCFLFFSCYPSAPYERKVLAMELILIMNNAWSILPLNETTLNPYSKGFTLPDSTLLLVGSIIDSWDRLRESSFRILVHFPTPLPGISSPVSVTEIIVWAKKLVFSPRVRESDAGALTLRLIFRKYVLDLGWSINVSSNVVNRDDPSCLSSSPTIKYVSSLIDWLRAAVEEGEKDLSEACKKSFVHGVLLSLRYTFEEMDWNSNLVLCSVYEIKRELEKLLELVMRITSLALWVVSADAWHLPEDMDGISDDDDDDVMLEAPIESDSFEDEAKCSKIVKDIRPSEQIVMVGCWLAMKEMSLLLGTIIRKIPLPTSSILKSEDSDSGTCDVPVMPSESEVMLDLKQLETIGNHFLEVLLKMKHNGAIDKTRAGFTALCNRLLCSNDPRLGKLTESWMDQLMERTVAKGQTVDDLLRRSAGIPAAFIAFFLSEPEGTPKRLLPRALRWLIDVANKSLSDQTDAKTSERIFSDDERISKIRDEGVIPTVHAFNVLKAAFNDANLATDTSGFSAEALIISIRSFSSSYWEIRNSACLAYTAMLRRMIGFLNVQKRESARRALTGLEFFHRYPSLHPFLFNELKVATELLKDGSSENLASNLASSVHPSLCPMLILLSRLKPATIATETLDSLDPFLFMPFIRKCSTQSNLRVRVLASRALSGLISNDKLPVILVNIASELPTFEIRASFNSIHGTLLQLISLLDINCRNLSDLSKKDQILDDLIRVLMDRSWIGKPSLCPCPILNGSFLSVLDNMLSITRMCQVSKSISAIWKLLWDLSLECLDVESFSGPDYYDPTTSELRKQAAFSYFNCVFQANKDVVVEEDFPRPRIYFPSALNTVKLSEMDNFLPGFQERLLLSMSDKSYEVRISTLKWLHLFLKAAESGIEDGDESCIVISIFGWINVNLQTILMNLLDLEENHRCTYYILKILFTWNLLKFKNSSKSTTETRFIGNMKIDLVLQFWEKLVLLYKVCRHANTREILLCCMGICVKRFAVLFMCLIRSNEIEQQAHLYGCISYYVSLIERHGDSSEPVNIRKAAAESMVASGLLEQAEVIGSSVVSNRIPTENPSSRFDQNEAAELYAFKILNLWSTCIKLTEDEDDGLRRNLATNVQKCFNSNESLRKLGTGVVPSQVDNVIISSFEHLSSIFGHWIEFFDYLSQWVLNTANKVVSRGDLVRRVFDKEIDNHHEEKLLICQICCSHLEKLPAKWGVGFFDQHPVLGFLRKWRMRFCEQLMSFAHEQVGKRGRVEWIGGMGNHKDAFLPLYANLLGFYALSKCIVGVELEKHESMLLEIGELGEIIKPFLRNPLISDLYLLVIKLHDSTSADKSESPWDVFDPYFLLK